MFGQTDRRRTTGGGDECCQLGSAASSGVSRSKYRLYFSELQPNSGSNRLRERRIPARHGARATSCRAAGPSAQALEGRGNVRAKESKAGAAFGGAEAAR